MRFKKAILIFCVFFVLGGLNSCHVVRYFTLNTADVKDFKRFPADTVYPGNHNFEFKHAVPEINIVPRANITFRDNDFEDFLREKKTLAFLVIRNDTILYEKYFDGFNRKSILPSFSVTKSIVSALVGIGIAEGWIAGVDDKVSDYLPELAENGFDRVSIRNLLNMRSGINYSEGYYNPFGKMAKFYYGKNLAKYVRKLKVKSQAGKNYKYQSANTQILGMILERSSGKKLPEILETYIWKKAGMKYEATWNMDSRKHKNTKAYCCLNARSGDFARFARLYLADGRFEGTAVIPEEWIRKTLQNTTDSRDSQNYPYHFGWRVIDGNILFAKGILGQYIYIDRSKKLIILRFGKRNKKVEWVELFSQIGSEIK